MHVSRLRRARQSAVAVLAAAGAVGVPVHATWRLNERHYGALQGLNKKEIFARWGRRLPSTTRATRASIDATRGSTRHCCR